jgi:peptide/nickel transport system substrate-binding protein
MVSVFGSCLLLPQEISAKEKVLIIGDWGTMNNLDPASSVLSHNIMFYRNLFQGLLQYRHNSVELEGDLAKSWTVSKDGLVYTFKLRENVQWHKEFGKVTARDVKFSFDRVMDPQTKSPFRGEVVEDVKEVKVLDDSTAEIHLKRPTSVFLHKCARPKPVAIVSQRAMEKYGKDFARNPIGSGPFVFESMSREQVVLTANKEYYEGPPKIDRVVYRIIPDADTIALAVQGGEIDLTLIAPKDKALLERMKNAGCRIKVIDRGAWHHLMLNPQFKPFSDVRVRKAIAQAIDRDAIIEHVLGGMAEKLNSLVPKGYFGYTEEGLRRYDYDLQKARDLLAEAGYGNGFEVNLDTHTSPNYLPVATAIQDQLGKVGIKVNLSVTDNPSWMKKVTSGNSQLTIYLPVRPPDADLPLTSFFHSSSFSPGLNMMHYNKLDKEIEEARVETNPEKRKRIYQEIQKRLMEDLPAVPLFMIHYPTLYRPQIMGLPDRDPVWGIYFYPIHLTGQK